MQTCNWEIDSQTTVKNKSNPLYSTILNMPYDRKSDKDGFLCSYTFIQKHTQVEGMPKTRKERQEEVMNYS